ncbi:MAG: spore germination protein, partial [Ruminococcus sp.]|nr:spore germination protein [Ruminococcus sp.]
MEENVNTKLSPSLPIDISLDKNLENIKTFTDGSSDVITKTGLVCGNRLAVLTCEGMTGTDTLAELIYGKLNSLANREIMPPETLMSCFFEVYMMAAEQLDLTNLGDLVLKMQSGFAVILVDGCTRAIGIGIQGYKSRGVDEPSSELNVRGSREGFVEVIRTNMSMIRRRIKSPTLVFELSTLGDRSNTDVCLCYISDK